MWSKQTPLGISTGYFIFTYIKKKLDLEQFGCCEYTPTFSERQDAEPPAESHSTQTIKKSSQRSPYFAFSRLPLA